MRPERQQRELLKAMLREPPRERTFAELFPWRNVARAVMLLFLILAIVAIKRSAGVLLTRVGDLWGASAAPRAQSARERSVEPGFKAHLGPGLDPRLDPRLNPSAAPEAHSPR